MLSKNQIKDMFSSSIHCSQIVLGEFAEELGYDREEAYRIANPFGGGCFNGDTCGCVQGAAIAIGMRYGNDTPGDTDHDMLCREKLAYFRSEFKKRCSSLECRELLGYDFGKPGEAEEAFASGKVFEVCPGYVQTAIEILQEMFAED